MNLSRFIALRIYRNSEPGKQVSRPAVLIAMVGIALGLAVMIIAVSVIVGFKSEVRDKIVGFEPCNNRYTERFRYDRKRHSSSLTNCPCCCFVPWDWSMEE